MGKSNNVLNRYFRNKERFADLFNGIYFNGKPVIKAENLTEASEGYVESDNFQHISADTLEAISVILNEPQLWKNREKYLNQDEDREEYNMCQAMREWAAEEQSIGLEKGLQKGENLLATLMSLLFADNRIEDAKLAAESKETRDALYKEYALLE